MMGIITTIIVCLLLAGLLGFILGCFFCKNGCSEKLEVQESEWKNKCNLLVHENDDLKAKNGVIATLTSERNALSVKLKQMDKIENERDNLSASLAALETEDWPKRYSKLENQRDNLLNKVRSLEGDQTITQAKLDSTAVDTESDYEIEEVEGIGKGYGKQLREMGIARTGDLISKCSNTTDIRPIADTMKLEEWVIRSWTSMADLCRVKGIGGQFAELLDFSGVHSVQQLASANSNGLLVKMIETNEKEHRVNSVPNLEVVSSWIEYAKTLETLIEPG